MSDPTETKKRSLSSYLSNVNSRREELEKIKRQQLEEQQRQEQEKVRQERQREEKLEEERLKEEQLREQSMENESEKGHIEGQTEEQMKEQPKESQSSEEQTEERTEGQLEAEDPQLKKEEKRTISRVELHSILKAPEDGSREDEEMDSDAPTEPASPPKPRRRKLVRGDRLSSLSPRQVSFDNGSDSELSDIDELEGVNISSSVLHGDSSPTKRYPSPRKAHKPFRQHRKGIYRDAGGRTRLQIACDKGNLETAKRLIEEDGYDVNDQDNAGNTALHEAALNGHLDVVKLLVDHGADVNVQSYEMFKDTPLIDASANGHLPVVKFLLESGADSLVCNAKGLTAYDSIEEDADLDDEERDIVRQIQECLREATRKALDRTASTKDPSPPQPRHSDDDYEFYWTDISSRAGREKLLKASKEGKLAYVGAYLENGGKIDVKSFFEAVKFGHEDITSLYLAFGAPVNVSLKDGTTPLMAAVGRGHHGTVKLLIDADADPTKKDKIGNNALYYAKNSLMGIIDSDEVQLIRDALEKHGMKVEERGKKRSLEEVDPEQKGQEEEPEPKKQELEPEEPKETPAERETRLKAEEEYFQRRMKNKKKKEQELLKKLALDEQKREEGKEKQRLQELEKMEADKRRRQLELEENQRQVELQRRKDIRSMYPLGLKLINFKAIDDISSFLPLYYFNMNSQKYVLDLQACVLLKDSSVMDFNAQPVEPLHREQLWNILKFIFLQGGSNNNLNLGALSLGERMNFERQEFSKFNQLPLHWIPYESIAHRFDSKEQAVSENMVEIVLVDAREIAGTKEHRVSPSPVVPDRLPVKFHHRNEVVESINLHNAGPLW
ncbi:hypothetical protein ZYGR_0AK00910 [Zygosaccharomyces rouxii]|uniref:Uncharacterized protein n=1 Tax=Zygosaccharomyces rouxii TaxID=4956 RepID=A0A1Q3ACU6_ZYGRO|nr:hypothetical protein ZYGR_0AK00910 [Zygosaccharomyces rouxii]